MSGIERDDGTCDDPGAVGAGRGPGKTREGSPAAAEPLQLSDEEIELVCRKVVEAAASVGRALVAETPPTLQNSTKLDWLKSPKG